MKNNCTNCDKCHTRPIPKPSCPKVSCNPKAECPFRKVVIPAELGDETGEYAPENGAYQNALVEYEASHAIYIYSADGIFTRLTVTGAAVEFEQLSGRPKYAGEQMTSSTNIPDVSGVVTGFPVLQNTVAANSAAIDGLSDDVQDLDARVSINTANITDLQSSVNELTVAMPEKASQESVDDLSTRVTAIEAELDGVEEILESI